MSKSEPANPEALHVVQMTEAVGGGVREHLRNTVPNLRRRGVRVDLILAENRAETDFATDLAMYRDLGCRVATISIPAAVLAPLYLPAIIRTRMILRKWHPHILHLHATKAGLVGRLAVRHAGLHVCYSPHTFGFEGCRHRLSRWAVIRMEQQLAARTDRFIFVSQAERQAAQAQLSFDKTKVLVIENGLPEKFQTRLRQRNEVREEWGIAKEKLLIGVPGRLAYQKGQDWLVKALARLDLAASDAMVAFCGDGPEKNRLCQLAARSGIAEHCSWLGHVPELSRCYRAFDLVIVPSRYEGLSYALLEAMAADIPVIVSDIPANLPRDVLQNMLTAVPVADCEALSQAIRNFLANREDWCLQARRIGTIVRREFTLEKQVERLHECYLETRMETRREG